ncbi:MAG: hypothetical protein HRU34_09210 [Richelia sp.]|nr:hypothetical protein [Richelia sp.]
MRDDFTQFSTIYQWFQTLIHPALMQRRNCSNSGFSSELIKIKVVKSLWTYSVQNCTNAGIIPI